MAINTAPIYSIRGDVSVDNGTTMATDLTTATGDYTGISANHVKVFTGGTSGGFVQRLHFKAKGTNTASVARIYLNNGSAQTTATNNTFFGEVSLPGTTASNTVATAEIDYPMDIAIKNGFTIWVGLGTTVAAGWVCTAVAGQYE